MIQMTSGVKLSRSPFLPPLIPIYTGLHESRYVVLQLVLHPYFLDTAPLSPHSPPRRSAAGNARASELIETVRQQVVAGGGAQGGVELLQLLGQGSVREGGGQGQVRLPRRFRCLGSCSYMIAGAFFG